MKPRKFDISIKYFDKFFACPATATYRDCTEFPTEESIKEYDKSLGRVEKVTITFKD